MTGGELYDAAAGPPDPRRRPPPITWPPDVHPPTVYPNPDQPPCDAYGAARHQLDLDRRGEHHTKENHPT